MPPAAALPVAGAELDAPRRPQPALQPPAHLQGGSAAAIPSRLRWALLTHRLLQIDPLTGPREGGTRVAIEGENLGLQVKEITHIQVAGVRCNPVPSLYVSAERSVWRVWVNTLGNRLAKMLAC